MLQSLKNHWPEYLIEAFGLGLFMFVACTSAAFLWNPSSPIEHLVADRPYLQRLLMGVAMGVTAISFVYSPWGQRSGAHINPCLTLTFLRLGKIKPWDAFFYAVFQFAGAIVSVALAGALLGHLLSDQPVDFAVTVPGKDGVWIAFLSEMLISAGVMGTVLFATNHHKFMPFTGVMIGCLLILYITFEAPFSGMSMNPARTVGSAVSAHVWTDWWIYFLGPGCGMLLAAEIYLWTKGKDAVHCAKLYHTADLNCIFKCGYRDAMEEKMKAEKEAGA